MKHIDLLIFPQWIIPIDENRSSLEHSGLAVHQGKIIEIGDKDALLNQYTATESVHLPQHIVTPGLINTHTHAAMSLLRGYADDLPLMEWLTEHIWPAESKWVNEEFVRVGTDLAIAEMIRGGTTCFNDMYFFPDISAKCSENAGIRSNIGMIVLDFPTVWADSADEYLSKGLALRDSVRHSELITTCFAPHAPYSVSDQPLERILTLADELNCQIHMHIHETAHEIEESTARYGMRPLERLDQLGLLGDRLMAVHMTQLLPAEIDTLADRGVHVVHCPQSNMKLASGFCPVHDLQSKGVSVSIGTDGASSNNDLDMVSEMQTASLLAKGYAQDPTALSAYHALEACTLSGAKALGLDHVTGSLEAGKSADIIAFDMQRANSIPLFNPISQLVYSTQANQVSDVWVSGKRLYKDHHLTTLDENEIFMKANHWRTKIAEIT